MRDRTGRTVEIGDVVRVQSCIGRYGQTRILEGRVMCIIEGAGYTLDTAKGLAWTTAPYEGYSQFSDLEHGHEVWTQTVQAKGPPS